jgi:hypothetical protein
LNLSQIALRVIVLLLVFFFILSAYPEPFHDLLFGKYMGGYVTITANHSGNETIVTNNGGPDLDKAISITIENNNQTYNLGLLPGSTVSFPYRNGVIVANVTLDVGGILHERKSFENPILYTNV